MKKSNQLLVSFVFLLIAVLSINYNFIYEVISILLWILAVCGILTIASDDRYKHPYCVICAVNSIIISLIMGYLGSHWLAALMLLNSGLYYIESKSRSAEGKGESVS